uniref:Uncharacterized protein n=2 Tax=viral metagenome TaxID=1070528 RepID=A0A6H1ZHN8_9ZZZZ
MELIMKRHDVDRDMIEILLTGRQHSIGVIHIDALYEPGNRTIHDRLRKGEELTMSLEAERNKLITEMSARLALAEADAFVMAGRLMGEDADTFGPECYKAMKRWEPKILDAMEGVLRDMITK